MEALKQMTLIDDATLAALAPPAPANGTVFSPCRTWRYTLYRRVGESDRMVMFLCLNPSTADEEVNDPTVTRCINYAKRWGYGHFYMMNLFAFRATDPRVMKAFKGDPVGPQNDFWLTVMANRADLIVAGWGTHGAFKGRDLAVRGLMPKMHCLKITQGGHPSHPLYLKADLEPIPFGGSNV